MFRVGNPIPKVVDLGFIFLSGDGPRLSSIEETAGFCWNLLMPSFRELLSLLYSCSCFRFVWLLRKLVFNGCLIFDWNVNYIFLFITNFTFILERRGWIKNDFLLFELEFEYFLLNSLLISVGRVFLDVFWDTFLYFDSSISSFEWDCFNVRILENSSLK